MREDNCYYCGKKIDWTLPKGKHPNQMPARGQYDHIIPKCQNGNIIPDSINLVLSCQVCNQSKNGKNPFLFVQENIDKFKWSAEKAEDFISRLKYGFMYLGFLRFMDEKHHKNVLELEWEGPEFVE